MATPSSSAVLKPAAPTKFASTYPSSVTALRRKGIYARTRSAGAQKRTRRAAPALHAAELAFIHPIMQQPLRFRMPLPPDLKQWLLKLRSERAAN